MSQHEIDTTDAPARAPAQATRAHPRPGSSLHYAAMLIPPRQRQAARALLSLWLSVAEIPLAISDPGVAETKLRWWAQEWDRAVGGTPQHPLSVSLAKALHQAGMSWPTTELWHRQIEAWIQLAHQNRWLSQEALDHHFNESTALAASMAACVLGGLLCRSVSWTKVSSTRTNPPASRNSAC